MNPNFLRQTEPHTASASWDQGFKAGHNLRRASRPQTDSVSGDGTRLYIANEDKGAASVLEIASGETVAEFEVGGEPEDVTTSPDGRFVYVTSEEDNQVSVIDTASNRVSRDPRSGRVRAISQRAPPNCPRALRMRRAA